VALYLTKMLSKLLVLLQAILLMSGCAAFMGFPPRVTDRSEDLKALQRHIDADAITECLKTLNEAEACRNKIIARRKRLMEESIVANKGSQRGVSCSSSSKDGRLLRLWGGGPYGSHRIDD
jgi:hypothetical protein